MNKKEIEKANIWVKRHLAPTFFAVLERDMFLEETFRIKHKTPRGITDFFILKNPGGGRPSKFLNIHKTALFLKYKGWRAKLFYQLSDSDWEAQRRWMEDIEARDEFI